MKTTQYGEALQAFLDEQYTIINDVTACKSWEDTQARKYALEVIERLFAFMSKPKTIVLGENRKYE